MTTPFKGFSPDRRMLLLGGAALVGLAACKAAAREPIAATRAGKVRGKVEEGVNVFKGVRYGATTEGRRFLPPQPPQPWTGTLDALEYGASSPQNPAGNGGGLYQSWQNPRPQSEDCLFLNVWTKGLADGKKRPVMVWFHGGGFATGSGSSLAYDGVRLANRGDVVLVTVNHRLNVFGYTYLGKAGGAAFADSGNAGNLDMIQSLEWVRDNIAEFGGDAGNVTIFGESGGGSKVSTLMAMPKAEGLFHRAIVQSGSTLAVRTAEAAAETSQAFMDACGAKTAEELQALPEEKLLSAILVPGGAVPGAPPPGGGTPGPVMDGGSLPRQPFTPDAPPGTKSVPMLIGTTKDEQAGLMGARDPKLFDLKWEELPEKLASFKARGLDVTAAIAKTRELYPDLNAADVFFVIQTETGMRRNAILQAERKSAQGGAAAYMYLLTHETPVDGGKWNAPHAYDLVFMFDNVAKSASFVGEDPNAQKVADAMSTAWIKFARDGNPGWDAYTADHRAVMAFDTESKVVIDPRSEERQMYAGLKAPA